VVVPEADAFGPLAFLRVVREVIACPSGTISEPGRAVSLQQQRSADSKGQ
jgi:hypothetical protein